MREHGVVAMALNYLQAQPFILVFLVVAAGYLLGRIKVKGISLGATVCTLAVALGLSLFASAGFDIGYKIPDFASTMFFNLFMFAVGMKVGPQFLSGLKRDARYFIFLGVMVPLVAIGLTFLVEWLFKLPDGMTTGLLAGSNTATPGLGAATDAMRSGASRLTEGTSAEDAIGKMSTAFAFAYCVSMMGFILLMKVLPHAFHKDVVNDAVLFQKETEGDSKLPLPGTADEFFIRESPSDVRTYRLELVDADGQAVGDIRRQYTRVAVERIRRDGKIYEVTDDLRLRKGDIVALVGNTQRMVDVIEDNVGPEVSDPELRDIGRESADVVVRDKRYTGKTLGELAAAHGYGLYLNGVFRSGQAIPYGPATIVEKGDVLRVTGSRRRIEALTEHFGRVVTSSISTDIATLAIGLCVGAFLGSLALPIKGIKFSLGAAVGLLLTGIALSIFRTRNPALGGPFPEPARQLVEDLGLNVFIAILGINSGASVLAAANDGAILPILASAAIVGLIPPVLAWIVGQYRFKMNSALLMGAVSGARCNSAGMRASQEETHSNVPAISYPVTFAISNIVLTLACYLFAIFNP